MVTHERDALASWRCQKVEGWFERPEEMIKREERHTHLVEEVTEQRLSDAKNIHV